MSICNKKNNKLFSEKEIKYSFQNNKKMTTKDIQTMLQLLQRMHPQAGCELHFGTPFELLVAVILSAQCTDKRVNIITDNMFKTLNKPEDFASLTVEELKPYIFSCGFFNNKGKAIIEMSKELIQKHNGKVPNDFEALIELPGVGRKTASVIMAVAFNVPAMPVDTHVNRVSIRLGLSEGKNVEQVEDDLKKLLPRKAWNDFHHHMIFHGRYICKSQNPNCDICLLKERCKYFLDKKKASKG